MIKYKFQSLVNFAKLDHHREQTWICPECSETINGHGIDKLAYTMDVCTCRVTADYDHVVEQIWHKACLVTYLTKHPEQQKDYRYLPTPSNKSVEPTVSKCGDSARKKSSKSKVSVPA